MKIVSKLGGAAWLRASGVKEISPLGENVAEILAIIWSGLYHLEGVEKVDWKDNYLIRVSIREPLATWDFNHLTQLVVLAHDACIRMQITPKGQKLLLSFHQRQGRDGEMSNRHPTLES